jgi:anti-sigma regulatory factor (Ser/Thr protein kinase)
MVVGAEPSGLHAARSLLRGIADDLALSDDDAADLIAAAGEALSNAYAHGASRHGGLIQISWEVADRVLTVRIEDDGPGFCPPSIGSYDRGSSMRGNGIRLMKELVEDVRFDFGDGTQVVLRKSLQGPDRA